MTFINYNYLKSNQRKNKWKPHNKTKNRKLVKSICPYKTKTISFPNKTIKFKNNANITYKKISGFRVIVKTKKKRKDSKTKDLPNRIIYSLK
jgi:hypothetical protein